MKLSPAWSTHLPVLSKIMSMSKGPVLELGSGIFSTPFLYWMSKHQNREFHSYDNDPKYAERLVGFGVKIVDKWNEIDIDNIHWGVVFIDHHPAQRRRIDAYRLRNKADFIIIHDSNGTEYEWEKLYPHFKYQYNYKKARPNTTILSNICEIKL